LPDRLEVVGHRRERVRSSVEVAEHLRAVRLALVQVVEVEPELLSEVAELVVALVDELAAVLVDLTVREEAAPAPAAPTEPRRRLVQLGAIPGLGETICARQPGEAPADDNDG